jgi:hypothetical protein
MVLVPEVSRRMPEPSGKRNAPCPAPAKPEGLDPTIPHRRARQTATRNSAQPDVHLATISLPLVIRPSAAAGSSVRTPATPCGRRPAGCAFPQARGHNGARICPPRRRSATPFPEGERAGVTILFGQLLAGVGPSGTPAINPPATRADRSAGSSRGLPRGVVTGGGIRGVLPTGAREWNAS